MNGTPETKEEEGLTDEGSQPIALKFRPVDDAMDEELAAEIKRARERIQEIVAVGRKARGVMKAGTVEDDEALGRRENALRQLQLQLHEPDVKNSPRNGLTAFQLDALRWMLALRDAGMNMLLNDQLGMGKSITVAAFLRVVTILNPIVLPVEASRPHLIVASCDNLHKWAYSVREWNPEAIVQVYDGSMADRQRLQREWVKKLNATHFMSAPEVKELEAEEAQPIFCCICPITLFLQDQEAFANFDKWEVLVVENEHHALFEDFTCIEALKRVRQHQQRILCTGQPLDSWTSNNLRWQWGEFLVREPTQAEWKRDAWTRHTILEKDSVSSVTKLLGRANAGILKTQSEYACALLVALCCLSLRRVRSDVEAQLGKIEEHSVSCRLSTAQKTQYHQALTAFASARTDNEERIEVWLRLFLRLRAICNCVDLLHDQEKLALADVGLISSSSGKLAALLDLLPRLVHNEHKRVVVYCQLEALLVILEMMLVRLQIAYVRITGSKEMQQRGLCHFALHPTIQVVLVSTRLACWQGRRSVPVYGADAAIVVDSDWNSMCDCKLRASWAQLAVAHELQVYRCHCESTIEGALLRVGSSLSDKVFCEMTPQEVVAVPVDGLGKPSWWSSASSASSSLASTLRHVMAAVENQEKYCCTDLEQPLQVEPAELDAEEHLLLANADELTPVEWYAVHYVYNVTEKKRQAQDGDAEAVKIEPSSVSTFPELPASPSLFDELAIRDAQEKWQERETTSQLYYEADSLPSIFTGSDAREEELKRATPALLAKLRHQGLDVDYNVAEPPQAAIEDESVSTDVGLASDFQARFKAQYRVPAPPPPPPKPKNEGGDIPAKVKVKKPRARPTPAGGVKRKADALQSTKTSRVDMDGIPVHDLSEFEDDDFWSSIDVPDETSWEDMVPISILGGTASVESSPATSTTSSTVGNGPTVKKKKASSGAGSTGRARKNSNATAPGEAGNRDPWSAWDDMVLKKLFELYGSNWTLIAHVFNASTSVSRYFTRKRTPRQCYDRYGKIITGSLSSTTPPTVPATKDGKPNAPAAVVLTPSLLAKRVGIPSDEELLTFSLRDSLPGVPPPSVQQMPSAVEVNAKRISQKQRSVGEGSPVRVEDVKSIRASFDAIMQCVKRKVPPPPIPLPPAPSDAAASASTVPATTMPASASTTPVSATPTTTAPAALGAAPVATTSPAKSASPITAPTTPIPSPVGAHSVPHKSHLDLVEMFPRGVLAPNEVIRRSKEAAAVAVQAAAAVASVGRDSAGPPPMGDVMGAAFGSASIAAARKAQAATSLGAPPPMNVNQMRPPQPMPGPGPGPTPVPNPASIAWGTLSPPMRGMSNPVSSVGPGPMIDVSSIAVNVSTTNTNGNGPNGPNAVSVSNDQSFASAANRHAMPVTTSALLHVLDRMPEIKTRIQAILNRNDCSEAQKVEMIARLLSSTNAINATAVAAAASGHMNPGMGPQPTTQPEASMGLRSVPGSQSLETPLPMPAALAQEPTTATAASTPAVDVEIALNGPVPDGTTTSTIPFTDMDMEMPLADGRPDTP